MKRSDYMVDMEYEKGMHYTDILRLAMKREEKALKLYNELQTKTQDEAYLKLFKILARKKPNTNAPWKRCMMIIWRNRGIRRLPF